MKISVLKNNYTQKIKLTTQDSAKEIDVVSWQSSCISHHALNNVH